MSQIVVGTQQRTDPDGSTTTVTTYSDGSVATSWTPAPGSPVANQATLQQKAQQALAINATFQAIPSPTNAQTLAQVQALTKQCNGIIRLLLNQFDSTTGT